MTVFFHLSLYLSETGPLTRMVVSVLDECHKTFVSCFHAFYPTGQLKWACLCDLLLSRDVVNKVSYLKLSFVNKSLVIHVCCALLTPFIAGDIYVQSCND